MISLNSVAFHQSIRSSDCGCRENYDDRFPFKLTKLSDISYICCCESLQILGPFIK